MASDKINISLTEVARQAGVSIATASRVLNGSGVVAESTTEKVQEVAERLGYMPNARYRLMGQTRNRGQIKSKMLGVLWPASYSKDFTRDTYYGRLFWPMEQAARKLGYCLCVSSFNLDEAWNLPEFIKSMNVEGIVFGGFCGRQLLSRLPELLPVVLVNTVSMGEPVTSLMPDEESGIRQVMNHLTGLGHRKILYFDIHDRPANDPSVHHQLRLEAFRAYVASSGLSESREVVLPQRTRSMRDLAIEFLTRWQAEGNLPTAIVCAADYYAIGFLEAAETMGLSIPRQLSVVGVDDTYSCEHVRPRLTSIQQPFELMAEMGINWLIRRIEGSNEKAASLKLDVHLVLRDSTSVAPN